MPRPCPMSPVCLWGCSGFQLASAAGPGACCSPCRQPVLGPRSGSCVPSWQSIWGQLEERAVEVLSAGYPHSDRWDRSQVREKSSLSTGMQMCLQGMCKAAFGNASCATLHQRYLCITWLCVIQGDVHSKQKGSETHRSFSSLVFQLMGLWNSKYSHYEMQEKTPVHGSLWVHLPALI